MALCSASPIDGMPTSGSSPRLSFRTARRAQNAGDPVCTGKWVQVRGITGCAEERTLVLHAVEYRDERCFSPQADHDPAAGHRRRHDTREQVVLYLTAFNAGASDEPVSRLR